MGCVSCTKVKPTETIGKYNTAPEITKDEEEIKQVAELPLKAKKEDFDLSSKVELAIRCSNLISDKSQVNPVVVFYQEIGPGNWKEKDRTEIHNNDSNPAFYKTFKVSYCFEKQRKFRFDVYSMIHSDDTVNLSRNTYIGHALYNIHEIVCSPSRALSKELFNPNINRRDIGTLTVTSEELSRLNHKISMQFQLAECKYSAGVSVRIFRILHEEAIPIYQTEILKKGQDCNPIEITVDALCRGEELRPVRFELIKTQRKGIQILGSFETHLLELRSDANSFAKKLSNDNTEVATLKITNFQYAAKCNFLDYIFGGCEVSLIIAIDFTRSNGAATLPTSLHRYNKSNPNEYIQAITAVGEILQYYDSDKRIPVYGFGAKLPPYYDLVSHCFALNGNIFDPEVTGVDGVIEVYKKTIQSVMFHGPTVFSHVIRTASTYASAFQTTQTHQHYFLLLILTDGDIYDIEATKDELVAACDLPLSIIIVGVGDCNFERMSELDADTQPLFSKKLNKQMNRDIVQFVSFSQVKGKATELAQQTLYEVPRQLLSFMETKGIKPNLNNLPTEEESIFRKISSNIKTNLPISSYRSLGISDPAKLHPSSVLLSNLKNKYIEELTTLGFPRKLIKSVVLEGVACMDINMGVQLINYKKALESGKSPRIHAKLSHMKQNEILDNPERLCIICMARPSKIVVQPCGHRLVCSECLEVSLGHCAGCGVFISSWDNID